MTEQLSPRQVQVRDLIALGFSNKQIAARLNISHRTVEDYRAEVFRKMNVKSALELLRRMLGMEVLDA